MARHSNRAFLRELALRQREGFEEFYQANFRRLVAILLAVLGDRQEAEDAVQEAFARAYLRWPRLSGYVWPRFVISASNQARSLDFSYNRTFDEWVGTDRTRTVEPTRIVLEPGATAVSVVSIELPIAVQYGCATKAWLVRPPAPGATALRSGGDRPEICDDSTIWVSPVYPRSVPITANYPG